MTNTNKTFREIISILEKGSDLSLYPSEELKTWKKVLEDQIIRLKDFNDREILGVVLVYHLVLLLHTEKFYSSQDIQKKYHEILTNFLQEEKNYRRKLKSRDRSFNKSVLRQQMFYFYKIASFYFAYLAEVFSNVSLNDFSLIAQRDKFYFLRQYEFYTGSWGKVFEIYHLSFVLFLRRHIFFYGILSAWGIVLVWQGIWGLIDLTMVHLKVEEQFFPYIITSVLGFVLLFSSGIFLKQTIGSSNPNEGVEEIGFSHGTEIKALQKVIKKRVPHHSSKK